MSTFMKPREVGGGVKGSGVCGELRVAIRAGGGRLL